MVYTIYKTTNLINGKFYLGRHKTTNPEDSYLGSGTVLKNAISKYGKENFRKEILFVYPTQAEAYQKEREIIKPNLGNPLCMNIHEGGAGIEVTDAFRENCRRAFRGRKASPETRKKLSEFQRNRVRSKEIGKRISEAKKGKSTNPWTADSRKKLSERTKGKIFSEVTKEKIREAKNGHTVSEETREKIRKSLTGRKHSEETKKKIGSSHLGTKHTRKVA